MNQKYFSNNVTKFNVPPSVNPLPPVLQQRREPQAALPHEISRRPQESLGDSWQEHVAHVML